MCGVVAISRAHLLFDGMNQHLRTGAAEASSELRDVWSKRPTPRYVALLSNLAATVNLYPVIRLAGVSVDCARLDKLVSPGQNWREASVARSDKMISPRSIIIMKYTYRAS